jgi:hypothetical protein
VHEWSFVWQVIFVLDILMSRSYLCLFSIVSLFSIILRVSFNHGVSYHQVLSNTHQGEFHLIRIYAITFALRVIFSWMRLVFLVFRIVMSENIVVGVEVLLLESAWDAPMVQFMPCISVLENHITTTVAVGSVNLVCCNSLNRK